MYATLEFQVDVTMELVQTAVTQSTNDLMIFK